MKLNRNYVAVEDNAVVLKDGVPQYAPKMFSDGTKTVINPTKAQYMENGFYPYTETPSGTLNPGYHWEPDGYGVSEGQAFKKWKQVANPPPQMEEYDALMEEHLKNARVERGYTTREPDTYLTSSNPRWAQDAKDWVAFRDSVMEYALSIINDVQSGLRQPPTLEEFTAGLPVIVWSYVEPEQPEEESEVTEQPIDIPAVSEPSEEDPDVEEDPEEE